jgi:hypothetical protein
MTWNDGIRAAVDVYGVHVQMKQTKQYPNKWPQCRYVFECVDFRSLHGDVVE